MEQSAQRASPPPSKGSPIASVAADSTKKLKKRPAGAIEVETEAKKSKRVRTIFTPDQLEHLEQEFARQQYMVGPERLALAAQLGLTEAQVKVWFQNRRIKWRKQHEEETKLRLARLSQMSGTSEPDSDINSDVSSY